MQFDPNLVAGIYYVESLIAITIMHIKKDDIFIVLSLLGLQPATEVNLSPSCTMKNFFAKG